MVSLKPDGVKLDLDNIITKGKEINFGIVQARKELDGNYSGNDLEDWILTDFGSERLAIVNNNIDVLMTLTTVNCPVADTMPNDIAKKIATIEDCGQIKVKLTFEPAWTKDMMSEDAKLALGF